MSASPVSEPTRARPPRLEPIRVLQVLGSLGPGGVQSWILSILRSIDTTRVRIDLLVHDSGNQKRVNECRDLGALVIEAPRPRRVGLARYMWALNRLIQKY